MGWFSRGSSESSDSSDSKTFEERINQGAEGDRADYASGAGADDLAKAEKTTRRVMNTLAAQRGANRTFGNPDPTDEEHHNRY